MNWSKFQISDDITEWPFSAQLIVSVLCTVVILLAGSWFYLWPESGRLADYRQQEVSLQAAIQNRAGQLSVLPLLQTRLDVLHGRYAFLLQQLPKQKELADILAAVNRAGVEHQLTFIRIGWGERQRQAYFYRLPLNIELSGRYDDVGHFFAAIARLPQIISVDDVEWQRSGKESDRLSVRILAYIYQSEQEISPNQNQE